MQFVGRVWLQAIVMACRGTGQDIASPQPPTLQMMLTSELNVEEEKHKLNFTAYLMEHTHTAQFSCLECPSTSLVFRAVWIYKNVFHFYLGKWDPFQKMSFVALHVWIGIDTEPGVMSKNNFSFLWLLSLCYSLIILWEIIICKLEGNSLRMPFNYDDSMLTFTLVTFFFFLWGTREN